LDIGHDCFFNGRRLFPIPIHLLRVDVDDERVLALSKVVLNVERPPARPPAPIGPLPHLRASPAGTGRLRTHDCAAGIDAA
jgi:hypothetical protein